MASSKKDMALEYQKNFDFSKLEVLGGYSLEQYARREGGSKSYSLDAFLLKYENTIVYIPEMSMKELKQLSPEIFQLFVGWCPFTLYQDELNSSKDFSTVYFSNTKELFPDYEYKKGDKPLYNLITYKNRLSKNAYHIRYGYIEEGGVRYLQECLYQKNELISHSIYPFNRYRDVVYEQDNNHVAVNLKTGEEANISYVDRVVEITDNYMVGVNFKYVYETDVYSYKIIRKEDGSTVYSDNSEHSSSRNYRIIADQYLAVGSYSNGVRDLQTGEKIEYPFKNACENFICHVTKTEFIDAKGTHPIEELPDMEWTGYKTVDFIKKFGGFIPHRNKIGNIWIDGTGWHERYSGNLLVFKDLNEGLFYKKRNELINLVTEKSFKVDDVMMSWIVNSDKVHVFDKKPRDLKCFSILQALKDEKEINGLFMNYGSLYYKKNKESLRTNFMRNEVVFHTDNITDIKCNLNRGNLTFEIDCKIKGKKITFETDMKCENFEVADIA